MVNSDSEFELLMKQANMSLDLASMSDKDVEKYTAIRNHAKKLTSKKLENYIKGRLGIIIDGTGKDFEKIKKQKDKLEATGYDTYMIFVNTSLEVAQERNNKRARKVSPKLVEDMWKAVQENIGKFQHEFDGNFIVIDNNGANEDVMESVWKKIASFADSPVKNHIAKAWIKTEMENKNSVEENIGLKDLLDKIDEMSTLEKEAVWNNYTYLATDKSSKTYKKYRNPDEYILMSLVTFTNDSNSNTKESGFIYLDEKTGDFLFVLVGSSYPLITSNDYDNLVTKIGQRFKIVDIKNNKANMVYKR
jgi:predicted kinase